MRRPDRCLLALCIDYPEYFDKLHNDIFIDKKCSYLYELMKSLREFNNDTLEDAVILAKKSEFSIADYTEISNSIYKEADFQAYYEYVLSEFVRKKVIEYSNQIRSQFVRYEDIKDSLLSLLIDQISIDKGKKISDVIGLLAKKEQQGKVGDCILSGLRHIDNQGGFERNILMIIGARPSVGKTSLALNLIDEDINNNIPLAFFTMETDADKVIRRIACLRAGIDEIKYKTGQLAENERLRVAGQYEKMHKANIIIYDNTKLELKEILRQSAKAKKDHGIQKIYIDYLQIIRNYGKTETEKCNEISMELKALAGDINCPVICLSQLNRMADQQGREPRVSDIKQSGQIEQDADFILLLHNEGTPDFNTMPHISKLKMIYGKCRDMAVGEEQAVFNKATRKVKQWKS